MMEERRKRVVEVGNIEAVEGDRAPRSTGWELLRAGIRLAVVPLELLPSELRGPATAAGRSVLRGIAELSRDVAEGCDRAADKL